MSYCCAWVSHLLLGSVTELATGGVSYLDFSVANSQITCRLRNGRSVVSVTRLVCRIPRAQRTYSSRVMGGVGVLGRWARRLSRDSRQQVVVPGCAAWSLLRGVFFVCMCLRALWAACLWGEAVRSTAAVRGLVPAAACVSLARAGARLFICALGPRVLCPTTQKVTRVGVWGRKEGNFSQ